jgi:septal ring factor EnvC (AmiA/AmiB activator)
MILARHTTAAQSEFCGALTDSLTGETGKFHTIKKTREQVRGAVADKKKKQLQAERQLAQSERQAFALRQQRSQELDEFERIQREAQLFSELIDRLAELPQVKEALDYDFPSWKGRVHWPLDGEVKSTVGRKIDREHQTETFETGIFIAGEPGAAVVNAADGEIAFAGRRKGLGNVVIIGHGSDYFSVIAHLDHISVIVGNVVYAGDQVGTVGSSHPRYGSGILFELRHGREVLDPLEWVR